MSRLLSFAVATVLAAAPGLARAACPQGDPADRLFAHPYGEPSAPCKDADLDTELPPRVGSEDDEFLRDDRGPRPLNTLGVTALSSGAALLGLGGASWVLSLTVDEKTRGYMLARNAAIGLAAVGGLVFITGATLVGIDALTAPAPTPDGRGAQLILATRW